MALRFAIHEIRIGGEVIAPRSAFDFDESVVESLEAAGAVRMPTEAEEALYRLANPLPEPAAPKAKVTAVKTKPAEPKPPEPADPVDPEDI